VLQAIISESMRRIKNMFRQKFCDGYLRNGYMMISLI